MLLDTDCHQQMVVYPTHHHDHHLHQQQQHQQHQHHNHHQQQHQLLQQQLQRDLSYKPHHQHTPNFRTQQLHLQDQLSFPQQQYFMASEEHLQLPFNLEHDICNTNFEPFLTEHPLLPDTTVSFGQAFLEDVALQSVMAQPSTSTLPKPVESMSHQTPAAPHVKEQQSRPHHFSELKKNTEENQSEFDAEQEAAQAAMEAAQIAVKHAEAQQKLASAKAKFGRKQQQQRQQQQQQHQQQQQFNNSQQHQHRQQKQHEQPQTFVCPQQQKLSMLHQSNGSNSQKQRPSSCNSTAHQQQLPTPQGSEYQLCTSSFISPLNHPTDPTFHLWSDGADDEHEFFTPLISPAMTPSYNFGNGASLPGNAIFSPLTSPAVTPLGGIRSRDTPSSTIPSLSLGSSAMLNPPFPNALQNTDTIAQAAVANTSTRQTVEARRPRKRSTSLSNEFLAKRRKQTISPSTMPEKKGTRSKEVPKGRADVANNKQFAGHSKQLDEAETPRNNPEIILHGAAIDDSNKLMPPPKTSPTYPTSKSLSPVTPASLMHLPNQPNRTQPFSHVNNTNSINNPNPNPLGTTFPGYHDPNALPRAPVYPTLQFSPALVPSIHSHQFISPSLYPNKKNFSPALRPMVSPGLKPILPNTSIRPSSEITFELRKPSDSDSPGGLHLKRNTHKVAEQRRRDSLKSSFEELKTLLPNIHEKNPSKLYLLRQSVEHIYDLHKSTQEKDSLMELMRTKLKDLMGSDYDPYIYSIPAAKPASSSSSSSTSTSSSAVPASDDVEAPVEDVASSSTTMPVSFASTNAGSPASSNALSTNDLIDSMLVDDVLDHDRISSSALFVSPLPSISEELDDLIMRDDR